MRLYSSVYLYSKCRGEQEVQKWIIIFKLMPPIKMNCTVCKQVEMCVVSPAADPGLWQATQTNEIDASIYLY